MVLLEALLRMTKEMRPSHRTDVFVPCYTLLWYKDQEKLGV